MKKLIRDFYLNDTVSVAKNLLGKVLITNINECITAGRIVETEAYLGINDKACHSYNNKRTKRTEIQYGIGGFAYVYLIYGMYHCLNVVTEEINVPHMVLIRALEPLEGINIMIERRKINNKKMLCNGPSKLCMAMGIDKTFYGEDFCKNKIFIEDRNFIINENDIKITPRININYAEEAKDFLLRFTDGSIYVSK